MHCATCGSEYSDSDLYCKKCNPVNLCVNCKSELKDYAAFCTSCGLPNPKFSQYVITTPYNIQTIAPIQMKLSDGEEIVKTYHCSTLQFPKCEGWITVTNKRIAFHGAGNGNSSRVMDEVKLESVSGISSMYGNKLKLVPLILGILLVAFSCVMLFTSESIGSINFPWWLVGTLVVGVILFCFCYKRTFLLKIFSSSANGAPISIGEGVDSMSLIGSSAVYSITARPTLDTNKMMWELGALIMDLQTLGDLAIEKWKDKE